MLSSGIENCRVDEKISRFPLVCTHLPIETIREGRKRKRSVIHLTLGHEIATDLGDVGMQVWTASFLLCDYVLYRHEQLQNKILFELGSGVGLLPIIASIFIDCKVFYCTDYRCSLISLAKENMCRNTQLLDSIGRPLGTNIQFRILDWMSELNPREEITSVWTSIDHEILSEPVVFLAADVIYDDELTNALFVKLQQLMKPGEVMWIAFEKRYNFSVAKLDLVANGVECFLSHISRGSSFQGQPISLSTFPQYFECYERTKDLELWEISRRCVY